MIKINKSQIKNHIKLIKNYRNFFDVMTDNNTDKIIKYLKSKKSITINPNEQEKINKKMFKKMKGGGIFDVANWIGSLFTGQIPTNIPIPKTDRKIKGIRPLKIVIITLVGFLCVYQETINECITEQNQLKDAQAEFSEIQIDIDDGKYFETTLTESLTDATKNVYQSIFGSTFQPGSKELEIQNNYIQDAIDRFGPEDGLVFINKARVNELIKDEKITGSLESYLKIMAKYDNLILNKNDQRNKIEKLRPDTFCQFIKYSMMQTEIPTFGGKSYNLQIGKVMLNIILDSKDIFLDLAKDPKNMFSGPNMLYMSTNPYATTMMLYITALVAKNTIFAFMKVFKKDKFILEILLELLSFETIEFGAKRGIANARRIFNQLSNVQSIYKQNENDPDFQREFLRLYPNADLKQRLAIQNGRGKNKKSKKIRKHKGINQKTGRLNKGYKYSGKKLKSGLRQIVKK